MRNLLPMLMLMPLSMGCVAEGVPISAAVAAAPEAPCIHAPTITLAVSAPAQLVTGLEAPLVATATDETGQRFDVTDAVSWSSSDPLVAAFGEGRLRAIATGRATLRAALGDASASADVQILPVMIDSLAMVADGASAPSGSVTAWRVLGRYNNGTIADVTAGALWTTSDPSIATFDDPGQVRAVAPGTAQISAWLEAESAAATLLVTN